MLNWWILSLPNSVVRHLFRIFRWRKDLTLADTMRLRASNLTTTMVNNAASQSGSACTRADNNAGSLCLTFPPTSTMQSPYPHGIVIRTDGIYPKRAKRTQDSNGMCFPRNPASHALPGQCNIAASRFELSAWAPHPSSAEWASFSNAPLVPFPFPNQSSSQCIRESQTPISVLDTPGQSKHPYWIRKLTLRQYKLCNRRTGSFVPSQPPITCGSANTPAIQTQQNSTRGLDGMCSSRSLSPVPVFPDPAHDSIVPLPTFQSILFSLQLSTSLSKSFETTSDRSALWATSQPLFVESVKLELTQTTTITQFQSKQPSLAMAKTQPKLTTSKTPTSRTQSVAQSTRSKTSKTTTVPQETHPNTLTNITEPQQRPSTTNSIDKKPQPTIPNSGFKIQSVSYWVGRRRYLLVVPFHNDSCSESSTHTQEWWVAAFDPKQKSHLVEDSIDPEHLIDQGFSKRDKVFIMFTTIKNMDNLESKPCGQERFNFTITKFGNSYSMFSRVSIFPLLPESYKLTLWNHLRVV